MLLSELLTRMTCGDLGGEELDEAVTAITNAPANADEEWVTSRWVCTRPGNRAYSPCRAPCRAS